MKKTKTLPKSLTTITPFSKFLALSLFILIPIGAFYLGIHYEQQTRQGFPNPFCKKWETICDPNVVDANGGCAPKTICVDSTPTPTKEPTQNQIN